MRAAGDPAALLRPSPFHQPMLEHETRGRDRSWRTALAPTVAVFSNRNLRLLELAWAGSSLGAWAYTVALAVASFETGGVSALGLVTLMRFLPAAVLGPFLCLVADRYARRRVMVASDLLRAGALATGALCLEVSAPPASFYALVALVSVASTTFRAAEAALTPVLARSDDELTATNAVASTIENVAAVAGPAAAGLLLTATSGSVVMLATAVTLVWSAVLVARIHAAELPSHRRPCARASYEATAGVRAVRREPLLRALVLLYGGVCVVYGALGVLLVPFTVEALDLGVAGIGYLTAALGVGGLIGGPVAAVLATRRPEAVFVYGVALFGLPIALAGALPILFAALPLLAITGLANTLVDVSAFTSLQTAVRDHLRARVFGALESVTLAGLALGAALAPPLVSSLGVAGALGTLGTSLALAALLARGAIRLDVAPNARARGALAH
jgi:MFS family permease